MTFAPPTMSWTYQSLRIRQTKVRAYTKKVPESGILFVYGLQDCLGPDGCIIKFMCAMMRLCEMHQVQLSQAIPILDKPGRECGIIWKLYQQVQKTRKRYSKHEGDLTNVKKLFQLKKENKL